MDSLSLILVNSVAGDRELLISNLRNGLICISNHLSINSDQLYEYILD